MNFPPSVFHDIHPLAPSYSRTSLVSIRIPFLHQYICSFSLSTDLPTLHYDTAIYPISTHISSHSLSLATHRSPYAPDASMDILFNSVNKAWLASAYPHSKVCTTAAYKHTTRDLFANGAGADSGSGVNGSSTMISADWSCSYCAGKIRLISITGGSLDTLVHAAITRLDGLAPIPRNLTRERLTPANTNSNTKFLMTYAAPLVKYLSPVHVLTGVVKAVISMAGMGKNGNMTNGLNETVAMVEEKVEMKGKEEKGNEETDVEVESSLSSSSSSSSSSCAVNGTCSNPSQPSPETNSKKENNKIESSATSPSPSQAFLTMTKKQWQDDMSQFQEPRHISLLTTQLTDVGFPVDHKVGAKKKYPTSTILSYTSNFCHLLLLPNLISNQSQSHTSVNLTFLLFVSPSLYRFPNPYPTCPQPHPTCPYLRRFYGVINWFPLSPKP